MKPIPIQPKKCKKCLHVKLWMDFPEKENICRACRREENRKYRAKLRLPNPGYGMLYCQSKAQREREKKLKANVGISKSLYD